MERKEIITYKQKAIMVIKDEERLKLLKDENHALTLKFLRRKPMTIQDLVESFKAKHREKSDKSIYRYISKLMKAKLVAKAGKRITSIHEGELLSETIYARSAISFVLKSTEEVPTRTVIPEFEVARLLLKKEFKNISGSAECFTKVANRFDVEKDKAFMELIAQADEDVIDMYNQLNWKQTNKIMDFVGWIAICLKYNIKKEVQVCYKE